VPSAINAALVMSLAVVAGSEAMEAGILALGMLGYQVSIGSLNDVLDAESDRLVRPHAPIPAGLVSPRLAIGIVFVGGTLGTAVSATFGASVLLAGSAGYACGLAYDLFMRRLGWGWLCFSAALPLLLVWTWLAAAGSLPPGWPVLLPLAALAGPALHLANSLVDVDSDHATGRQSLATHMGRERARIVLAVLVISIYLLAWSTLALLAAVPTPGAIAAVGATLMAALGVALSWRADAQAREIGWLMLAGGLAILAVVWASAVSPAT